jgi:hypothetical protein
MEALEALLDGALRPRLTQRMRLLAFVSRVTPWYGRSLLLTVSLLTGSWLSTHSGHV